MGRSRALTKIAKDIDDDGNLLASAISPDVTLGGATVYANRSNLPVSGNNEGDQAYVTANNRLYIWNGSGWYSVALLNVAPTIQSIQDSDGNTTPFDLSTAGVVTTITITAADSDGDPVTYSATADSDFNGLATLSQDENVFTVTPFSQDSASTTSGTITFNATDGINIASSGVQTFTLNFLSALWDETVLSIGTNSTNGLANSTFIDRSTNAHTVTPTGTPTQTAFHPYLDYWSVEFDGTNYITNTANALISNSQSTFTVESWVYMTDNPSENVEPNVSGLIALDGEAAGTVNYLSFGPVSSRVLYLRWFDGSPKTAYGSTTLDLNRWYHVSCVVNSNSIQFYVDGVAETMAGTTTLTDRNGSSTDFAIGKNNYGAFNGYVSNLRVTTTAVYTSNFAPTAENLTAVTGTVFLICQNNRFIDNSTNNYALTLANSPKVSAFNPFGQESEYAVGENKGSIYTNNDADYLTVADNDDWNFGSGDFTVECWVYNETYDDSGFSPVSVWGNPASSLRSWIFAYTTSTNTYTFVWSTDGGNTTASVSTTSETFYLKEWIHLAVARDGNTIRLFKNGEVAATADVTGVTFYNPTNTLFITRNGEGTAYSTKGYISDLRIVKGVALYTSAFTSPTAPVGNTNADLYLPMDNAGIFDKTGLNTLTPVGNASTSTTQTKFADTAMYFDGTGDYIVVPESEHTKFGSGEDFTIELWHYLNERSGTRDCLISNYTSFGAGSLAVFAGHGSSTISQYQLAFDGQFPAINAGTINYNQWVHLALVRSANVISLYIDGASVGSVTNGDPVFSSGGDWVIANAGDNLTEGDINGYIENLQILKGVAKYTSNFTVPSREQGRTYQAED